MKRGWVLLVGVLSVIAGSVLGTAVGHHPAPGGPGYYGVSQAWVSADGMTIGIWVPCNDSSLAVTETAGTVTLRRPAFDAQVMDMCNYSLTSVRLKAPLGDRVLVDAETGHTVPVLSSARILRPAHLPAGFALAYEKATFIESGGDEPTEPGLVQVFFKDGEYENTLSIAQTVGPAPVVSDGTTTTPVIVRGQLGTATPGQLQWSEGGQVFVITSNTYAYTMLSTVELVAIGDGLR